MIGLKGLALGLTSNQGGVRAVTAPLVVGDTTQTGTMAALPGTYTGSPSVSTKLMRDGAEVTSPYTKTAADAFADFWVEDHVTIGASTVVYYSAVVTVASTVASAPVYTDLRVRITATADNNAGSPLQVAEIAFYDDEGTSLAGTLSSNKTPTVGTVAVTLRDGFKASTYCSFTSATSASPVDLDLALVTPTQWHGGSFGMSSANANYWLAPGACEAWGKRQSDGVWEQIQSYAQPTTSPYGYAYGVFKMFAVPTYGSLLISAGPTVDDDLDEVSWTITGLTGTLQYKAREVSGARGEEVTGWTNTTATATVDADVGGLIRYYFRDSANPSAVIESAAKTICGKRPSRMGLNVGTYGGKPYYAPNFSMYRDLIDQASFSGLGGAWTNVSLPMNEGYVDKHNRLIAFPSGATHVRLNVGYYMHSSDLGEREWCTGGAYTIANYGSAWDVEGIAGSGISVNTSTPGPNGGVRITFANTAFTDRFIRILAAGFTPMTENTLRKVGDTSPYLLTDAFISSLDYINGSLRWPFFNWDNMRIIDMPHPNTAEWQTYMNACPNWSNRQSKKFRPEVMIEASNRTGLPLYLGVPISMSDDYLRGFAAKLRDDLDPAIEVLVTVDVEVWNYNGPFRHNFTTYSLLGYAAGLNGNTPTRTPVTVHRNSAKSVNVPAAYATNDLLFSDLYDGDWTMGIFQAKRDTAPGTVLPTGGLGAENADWRCIDVMGNSSGNNPLAGQWRFYGRRLYHVCEILKEYLGDRVIPTVETQDSYGNNGYTNTEPTNRLKQVMLFPETDGGPGLIDLCEGRWNWHTAPYTPEGTITLDAAPGNATPGATRQAAILSTMETLYAADTAIDDTHAARRHVAELNSTPRTVDGVTVRYSPALSSVGGYEGLNNHYIYGGNDAALIADIRAVNRSAGIEPMMLDVLTRTFAHGGNFNIYEQGTRLAAPDDFGIHDAIPYNPASLVAGRENVIVTFGLALP